MATLVPLAVVLIIAIVSPGNGSPNPTLKTIDKICSKLVPPHIKVEPQRSKIPYSIYLSRSNLRPGEVITVQICSSHHKIQEFYVQGRKLSGDEDPAGTFAYQPGYENSTSLESCGSSGALDTVQHLDPAVLKEHVKFKWMAPAEAGVYFLLATVVENNEAIWIRQPSMKIRVSEY